MISPTIQIYETDWRASRAGANIEALSPVVADSVVSAQFREIHRRTIAVEGFNSGHRHRETPGITEIDVLVAPTQVAGGFKLI